ncbi:hypothetical protein BDW22DRAFT_1361211 [Trametopsis cervina]|nr:hypothetical protein BDW22DRAFT_1361211 [Trametopsis cervina]
MSAYPAFAMGSLCLIGGLTGFARTRSVPSLVAGVSVGLLFLWSADRIRQGTPNGLEGAFLASTVLLLSSAPRFRKGPIPKVLTVSGAASAAYYGNTLYALRNIGH